MPFLPIFETQISFAFCGGELGIDLVKPADRDLESIDEALRIPCSIQDDA